MLNTDSDAQAFDPELDSKTDSVFYAFGIAQAMQQLADQYFFQGEMRGELVATTQYTDNDLRQLKNFSADLTNEYDSAYVYYRVINNCNYYLAHRDTTLLTGATNVTTREYAAVLSYRAWAYLQLVRNYGKVPFFTEPLTAISHIDDANFPEYGISEITAALAPQLEKYSKTPVPNYGTSIACGSTNFGTSKTMNTSCVFIPVDVILGDLYLEDGQYENAATSYVNYLTSAKKVSPSVVAPFKLRNAEDMSPTDMKGTISGTNYTNIFANNSVTDIVTYIPMSVSRVRGTVTSVPGAFGFDYYALSSSACWDEEIQLLPSDAYTSLTDSLEYYYYKDVMGGLPNKDITNATYGDMRSLAIMRTPTRSGVITTDEDDLQWINKFQSGNIILYRISTIYLHLAEALNRMEMPDLAFSFLKEGISTHVADSTNEWLSDQGKQYLLNTFLNEQNEETFKGKSYPIHQRGCGVTTDGNYPGSSPYQFGTEVSGKISKLAKNPTLYPGLATRYDNTLSYLQAVSDAQARQQQLLADGDSTTIVPLPSISAYGEQLTKADTIMAIEELLCDEEAMEFAFEGTRWYDLMRFARHKNRAGLTGNAWLADKVKDNEPVKALTDENNWYLPFKK